MKCTVGLILLVTLLCQQVRSTNKNLQRQHRSLAPGGLKRSSELSALTVLAQRCHRSKMTANHPRDSKSSKLLKDHRRPASDSKSAKLSQSFTSDSKTKLKHSNQHAKNKLHFPTVERPGKLADNIFPTLGGAALRFNLASYSQKFTSHIIKNDPSQQSFMNDLQNAKSKLAGAASSRTKLANNMQHKYSRTTAWQSRQTNNVDEEKIVGGENAVIQDHPYQVQVALNGTLICGGSIIQSQWIVSAAHCFVTDVGIIPAKFYTVRAGTTFLDRGGSVRQVSQTIVHDKYDMNTFDYDITLVKTETPLVFSNSIQPIALPTQNLAIPDGLPVSITGWGVTVNQGIVPSDQLQQVTVQIVKQAECQEDYAPSPITIRMVCAAVPDFTKDSCAGDSGGPLVGRTEVAPKTLLGIVSWGFGCAQPQFPGVYSRVTVLRSWIKEQSGV